MTHAERLRPGWVEKRFKHLADVRKGRLPSHTDSPLETARVIPYLSMEYLRGEVAEPNFVPMESGLLLAGEGDILLLWDGANAGEFMLAKEGAVSSTAARVVPRDVDPQFFYWACKGQEDLVRSQTVGMGIPHVSGDFLGNLSVPIPGGRKQRAIADYLDRETTRLDGLVAAKERVLELLAEKRRALITRAVTRGLDLRAPLRDSGVPWLGEIPAHWGIIKLKRIATISYGVGDELDKSLTSGTPLISLPSVALDGTLTLTDLGWADLDEVERPGLLLKRGDLLFNWRNGSSDHLAKTAYFDADGEFTHVGFLLRIRFDLCHRESRFYQAFLNALRATGFFLSSRAMVNNTFNQTELGNLSVVVPPLSEQRAIVAHIATETAKLDALRAATERTIALLKERRAALIAAAVTGQLSIAGAA